MYDPKLEELIDAAVEDGVLTDTERMVLDKKAVAMGCDLDEFHVILEGRLQKKQKEMANNAPKKSNSKYGDIRKCPSCGAPVDPLATSCSECGYAFTNVDAVKSAQQLFNELQDLSKRKSIELSQHAERQAQKISDLTAKQNEGGAMSRLMSSKSAQASERTHLIEVMNKEAELIEKKYSDELVSIIKCFPVPNSKEDLIELLSMAASNAYDNDGVVGKEEEAWLQKTDQIYQKILIVCASDKEAINRASSLISSLIKRLPSPYKKFTKIPPEQLKMINESLSVEKKERSEAHKKEALEICKKWYSLASVAALLLGILLCCIEATQAFGTVVLLVALFGIYKVFKKIKAVFSDNGIYN
ncbi:MAG: hypothetical protein HDS52_10140 [Barnesiella sp.]|nr:hypothetical protein [Barnesiella sp.]